MFDEHIFTKCLSDMFVAFVPIIFVFMFPDFVSFPSGAPAGSADADEEKKTGTWHSISAAVLTPT